MPVVTLPRAPITRPLVVGDPFSAPVKSVPWREWFDKLKVRFDEVAATAGAGSGAAVILEGSHAARLASFPAAANPETIYIETDRNRVMYISDGVNWNYQGGTIITTLAGMIAITAGLGAHDKNLTFYSVLFDRTYQWDGTAIGEINARDRSIHMFAEAPSTAGYALCDGSTVTRSRPDGTTYSWATPNLTGLYPKFGSSYSGVAGAAAAPTLHVTSKIPAGTLTHDHDYDGSTGNAVDNDNVPWVHRHVIDPEDVSTTVAFDGSALDGSDPWVIAGSLSGDAAIGGSLDMPEHQHMFPTDTLTGGAKDGAGGSYDVTGTIGGTTGNASNDHAHAFTPAGSVTGNLPAHVHNLLDNLVDGGNLLFSNAVFFDGTAWDVAGYMTDISPTSVPNVTFTACTTIPDTEAATGTHQHDVAGGNFVDTSGDHFHLVTGSTEYSGTPALTLTFTGSGGTTAGQSSTHNHAAGTLSFSSTTEDHGHVLDEIESGPVVDGPVAIDLDTLTVDVTDMTFTSTTNDHHHDVTISGITGDGVDDSGEAASPHHHTYEGTTDEDIQLSDFFCTVVATADADAQLARMTLMGYISL